MYFGEIVFVLTSSMEICVKMPALFDGFNVTKVDRGRFSTLLWVLGLHAYSIIMLSSAVGARSCAQQGNISANKDHLSIGLNYPVFSPLFPPQKYVHVYTTHQACIARRRPTCNDLRIDFLHFKSYALVVKRSLSFVVPL